MSDRLNIDNFLLIIGAMKCGTTSLYNYLIQHPEIASCRTKEINFFGNQQRFAKGFDFYQSLWNWQPQKHKYAIEATPSYTRVTHPEGANAAVNIAQVAQATGAKFKFIYILRHPIDRIESHYTQGRKFNHQDTAGDLSMGFNPEIIDTSRYAMQAREYYARFPAEDILLLNFEDLKSCPGALLQQVSTFLGIDPTFKFQDADLVHNPYSQKTTRVAIPGYSKFRKTGLMRDFIKFMSPALKEKIRPLRNLLSRDHSYEYVKFDAEQRQYLAQELASDLAELESCYGFNSGSWGIKN